MQLFHLGVLLGSALLVQCMPKDYRSTFPEREHEKEENAKKDDGTGGILALFLPTKPNTGIFHDTNTANNVQGWFDKIGIMQQVAEEEGFQGIMKLFQGVLENGGLQSLAGGFGGPANSAPVPASDNFKA